MLVNLDQSKSFEIVKLVILGSTGSIGENALKIIKANKERFELVGIAANTNYEKLYSQVKEFKPKYVAINCQESAKRLKELIGTEEDLEIIAGEKAASKIAEVCEANVVLAAIVGLAGLAPVVSALKAGKRVCLANKESVVAGSKFLAAAINSGSGEILPVDSEHSAIFQCLQGESINSVKKVILTASGGPFLNFKQIDLEKVNPKEALQHPNWKMGPKITVDSASLVNKALEVIEAAYLFGLKVEQVEAIVHPGSIVHSFIEFVDGSTVAQMGIPDMKVPIAYALNYPNNRLANVEKSVNFTELKNMQFLELDHNKFPAINLAKTALKAGGAMPAIFNSANELAVSLFLRSGIKFTEIFTTIEKALDYFSGRKVDSIEELYSLDQEIKGTSKLWLYQIF